MKLLLMLLGKNNIKFRSLVEKLKLFRLFKDTQFDKYLLESYIL